MEKNEKVNSLLNKIKDVMHKSINKTNYEKAMATISVGCQILYEYNQQYSDYEFEDAVIEVAKAYREKNKGVLQSYSSEKRTVLFYDGFGLDTRGVAKMYLSALIKCNYRVVYVTKKDSEHSLPETYQILKSGDFICKFIDTRTGYGQWVDELLEIIFQTAPKAMFYYTTPYDASAAIAFAALDGLADRFLIDLTDHAFWLGVKCNDYFCGSREMSASNQIYERGIDKKKLIKLGVNLLIDEANDHTGLPFDVTKQKYIFSGGALYKTLGDEEKYYYRMVDHFLSQHEELFFLYAGEGNKSEMEKILQKYSGRAFLISERKDFYYLIQHCIIYLNTYPMFGGMMMKYAANAGKLPITLRHEKDSDGLLLDQASRKIEYNTYEELIEDVDKLIENPEYLCEREALLRGSVISEERFVNNVRSTVENHYTDYEHEGKHLDVSQFRKEFYDRFDLRQVKKKVSRKINRSLFRECPWMVTNLIKGKIGSFFR